MPESAAPIKKMKKLIYTIGRMSDLERNCPHIAGDAGIGVFRYIGSNGILSRLLTEEDLFDLGMSEENLYQIACRNLDEIIPDVVETGDKYGGYICTAPEHVAAALRPKRLRAIAHMCGAPKLYLVLYEGVLRIFSNFADYAWYADERNCTRLVFRLGVGIARARA